MFPHLPSRNGEMRFVLTNIPANEKPIISMQVDLKLEIRIIIQNKHFSLLDF